MCQYDCCGDVLTNFGFAKALTDSHCRDIGDYDALVIVQQAGFEEGELLLYERLQMTPMLLERYAKESSEKSRRQMLAMCKADPEMLADVLGHLVTIATEKMKNVRSIWFLVKVGIVFGSSVI